MKIQPLLFVSLFVVALLLLAGGSVAEAADNTVFVPLPPCRVIDTRIAGGIMTPGAARSFLFRGTNYTTQGGQAGGCGVPGLSTLPGGDDFNVARAVVANVVAVTPAGSGHFRAWPANGALPAASVINYGAIGTNLANAIVLQMCTAEGDFVCTTGDITFQAFASNAHLVVDVVGYYTTGSSLAAAPFNVALGRKALAVASSGDRNVGIGGLALGKLNGGVENVAVGHQALGSLDTQIGHTAVGFRALASSLGSIADTALGYKALESNTAGDENVAVGHQAARANTVGSQNTAIGSNALASNLDGHDNTAVGRQAAQSMVTSDANTALGSHALRAATTGTNTAVGAFALAATTVGSANTAVGLGALDSNTTGNSNNAFGEGALGANSSGHWNVAVGREALAANNSGHSNIAVGDVAMHQNSTGTANVALGDSALLANLDGDSNIAVGMQAAQSVEGDNNVALGYGALRFLDSGNGNIAIGAGAGQIDGTASNSIWIGHVGVAGDSNRIRIGTAQVATSIAGIRGVAVTGGQTVLIDANGQLGSVSSSLRGKQDVTPMGAASEAVYGLRPVAFRYKEQVSRGEDELQYGLIAEEVAETFPELATYDAAGRPDGVRYHLLTPLLLNELQRLRERMEAEIGGLAASVRAQAGGEPAAAAGPGPPRGAADGGAHRLWQLNVAPGGGASPYAGRPPIRTARPSRAREAPQ
jgi:hypothetical protein